MKGKNLSRQFKIKTREQAKVFQNAFQRQLLLMWWHTPRSVKDLSDLFKAPIHKIHYTAGRLVDLELLEVVDVKARRGRGIKLYQSVANEFLVPQELTVEFNAKLRVDFFKALDDARLMEGGGTLFGITQEGRIYKKNIEDEDASPKDTSELWATLALDQDQIEELSKEVNQIIRSYATPQKKMKGQGPKKSPKGKKQMLIHFGYAEKGF